MRLVLQRVRRAAVEVDDERLGAIGPGLVVLAGFERGDGPAQVEEGARKILGLRIFEDDSGRMNLDLAGSGGTILLISQFTLTASTDRGRRPSFDRCAAPDLAGELYEKLDEALRSGGARVERGRFGARMEVELVNSGPVTFVLDLPPEPAAES